MYALNVAQSLHNNIALKKIILLPLFLILIEFKLSML